METPANPALALVDLDAIGAIAGPITVVDSTFAGPVVQRPLDHGVDLVLHAATKGIAGHNDSLLGVVAGNADLIEPIWAFQSALGTQASPFDAWNGVRGIRTLAVRSRHQSASALAIAQALEAHPRIRSVSYPFLESHPQHDLAKRQMRSGGTVVTFEVDGTADDTIAVDRALPARPHRPLARRPRDPAHPPGHDRQALHARRARRARHHRQPRPPVRRPRAPRRPHRRPHPSPQRPLTRHPDSSQIGVTPVASQPK